MVLLVSGFRLARRHPLRSAPPAHGQGSRCRPGHAVLAPRSLTTVHDHHQLLTLDLWILGSFSVFRSQNKGSLLRKPHRPPSPPSSTALPLPHRPPSPPSPTQLLSSTRRRGPHSLPLPAQPGWRSPTHLCHKLHTCEQVSIMAGERPSAWLGRAIVVFLHLMTQEVRTASGLLGRGGEHAGAASRLRGRFCRLGNKLAGPQALAGLGCGEGRRWQKWRCCPQESSRGPRPRWPDSQAPGPQWQEGQTEREGTGEGVCVC